MHSRLPLLVLTIELLAAAGYLIQEARRLWFFGDDWEFLLNRRLTTNGLHNVFYPHNEHWSTLPILVFRGLFTLFGVRHYLPYALAVIVLHIAVCLLLWRLLQRVGVDQWISVGLVGVMAFLGAGAENTLWDFQIGFVGSTFFGLLGLLLVARPETWTTRNAWLTWVALVAGLMCSGMGLPLIVAVGVLACSMWGLRFALEVVVVPIAIFVAWFLAIGHQGIASDRTAASTYLQVPTYFWTGITNTLAKMSGVPESGVVLLALLVVPLLLARAQEPAAQLAMACLAGAAGLYLFTGVTRIRFGVNQATASRYVYIAGALMIPLIAWSVQRLHRRRVAATTAFWLVTILAIVNGIWLTHSFADGRLVALDRRPQRILAAAQIVKSGQRTLSSVVDPVYDPDISVPKLRRSDIMAAFPSTTPSRQGLLDAESYIQVGVSAVPYDKIPPPSTLEWAGVAGPVPPPGCTSGAIVNPHAYLDVRMTGQGGMVELTSAASRLNTQLRLGALTSAVASWPATSGHKTYIGSVVPNGILRIMLPPSGTVTVCTPA